MTKESTILSKLSRPRLFRILPRDRLFRLLDAERREHPVVWIAGPPGAGKTSLVANYLEVQKLPGIWYQVDGGDSDPASLFYYLAMAARKAVGRKRLVLPLLTPEYLPDLPGFTRRFFRKLFTSLPSNATLVLDNYQEAAPESVFHNIIQGAIAELRNDINLIVISRLSPPPQYAREIANNLIAQIGWEELCLNLEETKAFAATTGLQNLNDDIPQLLQEQTRGWVAGLVLMMERFKGTGEINYIFQSETMEFIFNYFAGQIFEQTPAETQEFLMCTAILPRITLKMAINISGNPDADELLDSLYRRRLFTDRRTGSEISYQYHALFREFLLHRGRRHFPHARLLEIKRKGALLAEQDGETEAAAALLAETEGWRELARLISNRAPVLLAQGRHQTIQGLIATLPQEVIEGLPWILYWQGLAQLPFNNVEARGTLERAYLGFGRADDSVGLYSSWAGVMNSFFLEFRDFTPVDRWITEFERLQIRYPEFPSLEIELRTYLAMGSLMHRQPQHPLLRSWSERCLSLLDNADRDLAILLGGLLVLNFSYWSKTVKAQRVIDQLSPGIHSPDISRMSYIFWFSVLAAYYAWRGKTEECSRCVEEGLRTAENNGLHFFDFLLYGQAATCSLTTGDLIQAESWISKMATNMHSYNYIENSFYHHLQANATAQREEWQQSVEHARASVAFAVEAGSPPLENISRIDLIRALFGQDDEAERKEQLHAVYVYSKAAAMPGLEYLCFEAEAVSAFKHGDEDRGRKWLRQALALSRTIDGVSWLVRGPKVSADIYNRALAAGIEVEHVCHLIRRHQLSPPDPTNAAENWPWRVRVNTLGRFEVLCDDEPIRSSIKAQHKPLELLKCLCAFGGSSVNQSRVTDALWPDAEGDTAEQSLRTTLHRLRKLLQYEQVVRLSDRHLSLDPNYIWVDCLVFDQAAHHLDVTDLASLQRALNRYQGHFLEGETAPWALAFREQLRGDYQRLAERLGCILEQCDDWQGATECYRKAIEIDPLAETFYRHLMLSYKQLGQRAEALAVYQRCRQSLSIRLGISPAPQTRALYQALLNS